MRAIFLSRKEMPHLQLPNQGSGQPSIGDYERSIQAELDHYSRVENIHELPNIYHFWSDGFLRPHFEASGFRSIPQFFANHLIEGAVQGSRFLSIGAGYCETEIQTALDLRSHGLTDFTIECLELNDQLLQRGMNDAANAGVSDHLVFTQGDFNAWASSHCYDGIMANHSLHHVTNLEGLFDEVKSCLSDRGNFCVNDMIGRNGHQRWPEALNIVNRYWAELDDRYKYNHLLRRFEKDFVNWDCSTEGFEGIRAQDILPLLVQRFSFTYFFGFANVIGPFIDRTFGHNFNPENVSDQAFINRLHEDDESGFQSGALKPTQMLAVMNKAGRRDESGFVRGLSPERSVRVP